MAGLSLILSIMSLFSSVIPVIGFVSAIFALIIAILVSANKNTRSQNIGAKRAALIMAIMSTIISTFILACILTGASVVLDVANGILDSTTMIENNPELSGLVGDLYEEYFAVAVVNKFTKNDITAADAEIRYNKVLSEEYAELYTKGYRIEAKEDLSFTIISPSQGNI